jgi:hypothetical protein
MEKVHSALRVAVPFHVTYHIKNKTSLYQKLKVVLNDADPANIEARGFLITGLVNGEIALGPFESHTLSYTVLATRAGKIGMPEVGVSSNRYKTWVIHEAPSTRRTLFISP